LGTAQVKIEYFDPKLNEYTEIPKVLADLSDPVYLVATFDRKIEYANNRTADSKLTSTDWGEELMITTDNNNGNDWDYNMTNSMNNWDNNKDNSWNNIWNTNWDNNVTNSTNTSWINNTNTSWINNKDNNWYNIKNYRGSMYKNWYNSNCKFHLSSLKRKKYH